MQDQIQKIWQEEIMRQQSEINLIASENYASKAVMMLQGSEFTNKYAEGYPGARYYAGCGPSDQIENLAIDQGKKLFKADFMNVQPHSGSSANAAVYQALLKPGDTLLGLSIKDGGHLTHGVKVNFSGQIYDAHTFGIQSVSQIDYDDLRKKALACRPKLIVVGFSSFSGLVDWKKCREIADEVGAWLHADIAHVSGLIAANLYPSPVPYADVVTSTTHKTLRGPRSGIIFGRANEVLEKKINKAVFPGSQGGPLMHVIAAKAQAFSEALQPEFISYQKMILDNARALSESLQSHGLSVLGGVTENHMLIVDCTPSGLTGKQAEEKLQENGIIVNRNGIKDDPLPPSISSGIRIGVPAVTTRGMQPSEMKTIAALIAKVLLQNESVSEQVMAMCHQYPIPNYPSLKHSSSNEGM